jgi:hypothetical protein
LAIFTIFHARCMLESSRYTQSPCLAIVADMLKSSKKLVAASNSAIWLLSLPYTTL